MSFDERALIEHVMQQRWYGAKSRGIAHAQVLDSAVLRTQEPQLALALVEVRYETGVHDLYQLLFSFREGESGLDVLADEPALARELVSAMRSGLTVQSADGSIEFQRVEGFAGLAKELGTPHVIDTEQSNTSIAFDDEVILKMFRRLEAGINPELELLRFLTDRGFPNIAALGGWYSYSGGPLAATLGILQEYVPDAPDGWELALDELAVDPERFLGRLRRLGEVTGELHTVLASDPSDPSFAPEVPSVESLGLLTATVDEEIAQVFLSLPEDDERLAPIAGRGEEVREQLRSLTHAGTNGKIIRVHGDYHLGQTLWAGSGLGAPSAKPTAPGRESRTPAASGGDWVLIDFEGEPARSLTERRRKRSPLRDVAGMLRSFAYVAIAAGPLRGAEVPDGWESRAREKFLDGYLATVDPSLLPNGQVGMERLLTVFELEKAVYELRYELDNRPDWVGIPVAAIQRLIDPATAPPS
jgi:predicted trehalose synthase